MNLEYWYMLPVSILIATTAMASGVEGGTFFAPVFILALQLPPEVAIGTALITEVFGFASGLYAYSRKRLIDYRLGLNLLMITIPMALLGTWVAGYVKPDILKVILGVGLFAVAVSFLHTPKQSEVIHLDELIQQENSRVKAETAWRQPPANEFAIPCATAPKGALYPGWAPPLWA